MFIQCFITKFDSSDVFVDFEGVRYIFSRNAVGDAVCFVGNQGHVRRLLSMGPASYDEYIPPDELGQNAQPGAAPVPLGKHQERREPEAREPLPDNPSVDDALAQGGTVETAPPATEQEKAQDTLNETAAEGVEKAKAAEAAADKKNAKTDPAGQDGKELDKAKVIGASGRPGTPTEVEWQPEAVATKIKEFQGLNKPNFKSFVDANSERIMGWPKAVRAAVAKKLDKNFPNQDPGIEGFVINDYLGNDTGDS